MDHLSPLSSFPLPPSLLPTPHLPRRRRASLAARATVPPLMWQWWNIRAWKAAPEGGTDMRGAGIWESTASKSGCPRGICHSDLPLPEAGGSLKSHLLSLRLGAKEVVLQRLKWLCHMIQWAIVGKGAQGLEHTIAWENCSRGTVYWDVCIVYMNQRVGGRSFMRVGRCQEVKIVYVQVYAVSEQWGERENVRLWFAAVYPDICLRYCHTDLSISLLISISAEMKIEADVQLNKTAATTTTKPARLTLFRFIRNPLSVVTFSFDRLVTVCLRGWGAKERERSIKNSDRLREEVRGRTDSGGMGRREKKKKKRGKSALVMQAVINIKRENKIYCGTNGTLACLGSSVL